MLIAGSRLRLRVCWETGFQLTSSRDSSVSRMRHLITTLLLLSTTVSCSETPTAQQETAEQSAGQPTEQTTKPTTPASDSVADRQPSATSAPAEQQTVRIGVGDRAPGFSLQDQAGREQSLKQLLAQGPVALIFYRSADW